MSDAPPQTRNPIAWRDKALFLSLWLGLALLLFRPLIWNDIQALLAPAVAEGAEHAVGDGSPWFNLLSDLACMALACIVIVGIVSTQMGSIAFNTFREAVRNRILYFILFFALVLMGASGVIEELAIAAHNRIMIDLGLTCVSFFGLMVAVFMGISLVYNELEKRTIYTIVSKPVHRWQFLTGKFFGLLLTVFVIVSVMTLFFFAVLNYQTATTDDAIMDLLRKQDDQGQYYVVDNPGLVKWTFLAKSAGLALVQSFGNVLGFESSAVSSNLLIAVAMIFLELTIVTAFAVLFSSFSTPTLSAVLTVMVFLAGRLNEDIMRFAAQIASNAMKDEGAATFSALSLSAHIRVNLAHAAALIVPNLDSLNVMSEAIYKQTLDVWRYSVLYAFCYTAGILIVSMMIFARRNFK